MNWGTYGLTLFALFVLFLLTGGPVTPSLKGYSFNHYKSKDDTYFFVLYWHLLLGAAFVLFAIIGGIRNACFAQNTKQVAYVWAFTILVSSVVATYGVYKVIPSAPHHHSNETDGFIEN
eukprot:m.16784 g.16784  ORF g.16784 m.16784 type:complete len:119 (+) comp5795_c0_seq2:255-611(+)